MVVTKYMRGRMFGGKLQHELLLDHCLWTFEIKMDRLRKLEDAISRENEKDISNLEEYFTKLLKEKQSQRQLDESALLDKILNMRKDEVALSLLPEDQFNLLPDKAKFHVPR